MLFSEKRRINLEFLTTLKGIAALIKDPGKTESVFDIEDSLRNTKATQLMVEYIKSQPGVAQIIEERYTPPPVDLDALLKCPPDSLGYAYASYLTEAGFDPNFYRKPAGDDDISYISLRIRQTHDIWHVLTDFGADEIEELGLKAFELAQSHRTMSAVLISGGLLKTLFNQPENLERLLDRIAVGYRMGSKAKPFLAQKWEEHWDKSLAEWRAELGVEPTPVYVP
ncbi:MAG TPA: hypothetical protein DDW76_11230 [Cyanobacteria bacterium UBA11369]|nr:hypothetical protein [Cyanobacteria bacterium UBA11371]HBE32539.1 hypothetical protein [Cyanobacteria bacterium UBA11368]HBE49343.1 hypothetical protein [Cyanobacteria bacterium UBA11369]